MLAIIIDKINNSSKISSHINNHHFKIAILYIIIERKNFNYILKF